MYKSKIIAVTLLMAVVALLAGNAARAQAQVVHIGYVPVLIYAPLYVAQERGYFAQENLTVELTPVQGGSEPVVQLAAGNFDASVGGVGAGLLNVANKGLEFRIVAPMHSERAPLSTSLVISAKRTDIKTVADLKGKKVSINATGAATEYWLSEALRKAGLTFADIQLQTVGFANVPGALDNGSLDAAMLGEPLTTQQVGNGVLKILADDFIDGFYATYLYMGMPLLRDRTAVADGFMRAYLKACRDLSAPDAYRTGDIAAIIEKYTKVPAAIVAKASRPYYEPNGVIPVKDIETLQAYFLTRGSLEYKQPLDISKFIDTSLVQRAVQVIGPYAAPTAAATTNATMSATMAATIAR